MPISRSAVRSAGGFAGYKAPPAPPSEPIYTATHYVTADAPSTVSQSAFNAAASSGSPCSMLCAVTYATAGDQVQVAPGVYSAPLGDDRWAPGFGIRGSGTSTDELVFFAQYPAAQYRDSGTSLLAELRNGGTDETDAHPVIGTWGFDNAQKYVTLDGFYINCASGYAPCAPSGGSVMISCRGSFTISRFAFDVVHLWDYDNFVPIFIQPNGEQAMPTPIRIVDCLFDGGTGAGNYNASCITTYYCQNLLVENNTFRDVNCGMYIKGANNGGVIRYNLCESAGVAFADINSIGDDLYVDVYQNIVINPGAEAFFLGNSPPGARRGARIYNNTVVADDPIGGWIRFGGYQNFSDSSHYNNLYAALATNTQVFVNAWESDGYTSVGGYSPFDYNLYYNNGSNPSFAIDGATSSTLSAWQTASGEDAGSVTSNPSFTNAAGGDYTISGAALTAGRVGGVSGGAQTPVGAYITGSEQIGKRY